MLRRLAAHCSLNLFDISSTFVRVQVDAVLCLRNVSSGILLNQYHDMCNHQLIWSIVLFTQLITRYFFHSYGYACTGVRLRKASLVRNHHTPLDFVTDRWRSQILRYSIFTIQVLASFVYLAAQVNSLQSTFNAMFGFDPSDVWPVIVIMIIILGEDTFIRI